MLVDTLWEMEFYTMDLFIYNPISWFHQKTLRAKLCKNQFEIVTSIILTDAWEYSYRLQLYKGTSMWIWVYGVFKLYDLRINF